MNIRKTISIGLTIAMLSAGNAFAAGGCCTSDAACCEVRTASCCVQNAADVSFEPLASLQGGQALSSMEQQLIREVNADRARYGLPALQVSAELTRAARIRAKEIASKFSHTRPDGSSWSTVSGQAKGENIARGHNSVQRVMAAWMSSSGHRRNILRESFGSIGVCALNINGVIHWVQLFGR